MPISLDLRGQTELPIPRRRPYTSFPLFVNPFRAGLGGPPGQEPRGGRWEAASAGALGTPSTHIRPQPVCYRLDRGAASPA